jgi:site-specific recombinase XerD
MTKETQALPIHSWSFANQGFYANFRTWLKDSGYSPSTLNIYGDAVRQALGYLQKDYWKIEPERDLERAWHYLQTRPVTASSLEGHHKGLIKLGEYLRIRLRIPTPERRVNWAHYLEGLPEWLCAALRAYITHRGRKWMDERRHELTLETLSSLTRPLRWVHTRQPLTAFVEFTPEHWYAYLDERLEHGLRPATVNGELSLVLDFARFLESQEVTICERLLRVPFLKDGQKLPRDASLEQLRTFFQEIELTIQSQSKLWQHEAVMDRAWFLLMLHGGLRTGEVRRLKLGDIDFDRKKVRIEQSKGLKDRMVYLTHAAITALKAYLPLRGPLDGLPEYVFIFRHRMLTRSYCFQRMQTYSARCGVYLTPHQLRHSCATLLLNAGAPVTSVKTILGHRHIDTTLGYARLYDGTLAADYYRAMNEVERQLELVEGSKQEAPGYGELVALVDSLRSSTLNESQSTAVQAIREGILALARKKPNEIAMEDVKDLAMVDCP